MNSTACLFLFQSADRSEGKRLDTRDEVVISRVKLVRMFLPGRATRSVTVVLQEECESILLLDRLPR